MKKIFLFFVFVLILSSFVLAQDTSGGADSGIKTYKLSEGSDFFDGAVAFFEDMWNLLKVAFGGEATEQTRKLLGFDKPGEKDTFLGIPVLGFSPFYVYFFVGFIGGLFLFGIFWILRFFRDSTWKLRGKKPYEQTYLKENKLQWLEFVAGAFWKVIVLGFAYMVLMQIPILNRILQLITLDFYFEILAFKALFFAIVVGFIPQLFEKFWKLRVRMKYQKELLNAGKIRANVSEN